MSNKGTSFFELAQAEAAMAQAQDLEKRPGGEGASIYDLEYEEFLISRRRIFLLRFVIEDSYIPDYFKDAYPLYKNGNPFENEQIKLIIGILALDVELVNSAIVNGANIHGITPEDETDLIAFETRNPAGPMAVLTDEYAIKGATPEETLTLKNKARRDNDNISHRLRILLIGRKDIRNLQDKIMNITPIMLLSHVSSIITLTSDNEDFRSRQRDMVNQIRAILIENGVTLTEVPIKNLKFQNIISPISAGCRYLKKEVRTIFFMYMPAIVMLMRETTYGITKAFHTLKDNETYELYRMEHNLSRKQVSDTEIKMRVCAMKERDERFTVSENFNSSPLLVDFELEDEELQQSYEYGMFLYKCLKKVKERHPGFTFFTPPTDSLFILELEMLQIQKEELKYETILPILSCFSIAELLNNSIKYEVNYIAERLSKFKPSTSEKLRKYTVLMIKIFDLIIRYIDLGILKSMPYFMTLATRHIQEKERKLENDKQMEEARVMDERAASSKQAQIELLTEMGLSPEEITAELEGKPGKKTKNTGASAPIIKNSKKGSKQSATSSSSVSEPVSKAVAVTLQQQQQQQQEEMKLQRKVELYEQDIYGLVGDIDGLWWEWEESQSRKQKQPDDPDIDYQKEKSQILHDYDRAIGQQQSLQNEDIIRTLRQQKYLVQNTKWITMYNKFCQMGPERTDLETRMTNIGKIVNIVCKPLPSRTIILEIANIAGGVNPGDIHITIHWKDYGDDASQLTSAATMFHYKDNTDPASPVTIPILYDSENPRKSERRFILENPNPQNPVPDELQVFLHFINTPGFWPFIEYTSPPGSAGGVPGLKQAGPKGGFTRKKRTSKRRQKRTYKKQINRYPLYKSKKLVKPIKRVKKVTIRKRRN